MPGVERTAFWRRIQRTEPELRELWHGHLRGNEVNTVRALAAGGPTGASGSEVIYATTDGLGSNEPSTPVGGNVWVTTNATAVSGTVSNFANTTLNGPGGGSINPNQFPISSVAIDSSDPTGKTAYVTVMGFTAGAGQVGPGHVWQTTNAGKSWIDFTGTGANALPDSPANAVVVDPSAHIVYVGTDVGVFQSPTSDAAWTELGPSTSGQQNGFLPNVAVTALALFNSGGQKLLRASTYGRGVWQFNLIATPDFQIAVSNNPLTAFVGATPTFNGTITAVNGYNSAVTLSCTAGSTAPPSPCTPNPASFTPVSTGTAFSLTTGNAIGDYSFNLQAVGSDANTTTHVAALVLHVVNLGLTTPSPSTVTEPRGGDFPAGKLSTHSPGFIQSKRDPRLRLQSRHLGRDLRLFSQRNRQPNIGLTREHDRDRDRSRRHRNRQLHRHAAGHNRRSTHAPDHFVCDGRHDQPKLHSQRGQSLP